MRKFQVLEVAVAKLRQVKWLKDRDGFVFVVNVLGDTYCMHLTGEKRRQFTNHC